MNSGDPWEEWYKKTYDEELKDNPPLPPLLSCPDNERKSIFWRMGEGEVLILRVFAYFKHSEEEIIGRYKNDYPEPEGWEGFYNDITGEG